MTKTKRTPSRTQEPQASAVQDHRLDRLYDYTKWHLGVYITYASALGAIAAAAVSSTDPTWILSAIWKPWSLVAAIILMVLAGLAGGVVATLCIASRSFDECTSSTFLWIPGKWWTYIEHACFWVSVITTIGTFVLSEKGRVLMFR